MASHSSRRNTAKLRASYTGESFREAQAGIPRKQVDHGLDTCTPGQRALRALLAIAVFNADGLGAPPRDWRVHVINLYTLHMSARFDDLHIATDCPDNVARRVVTARYDAGYRLPGLRTVCHRSDHTTTRHLSTGTSFQIRYNNQEGERLRCGRPCSDSALKRDMLPESQPMGTQESTELAAVPPMSVEAQTLLAALLTRMSVTAPDLSWATNGWHNPPDAVACSFPSQDEVGKALWGAGDYWTLRWSGFPNPEFVSAALTDPEIGLSGATVHEKGNDIVVSYRSAQLRLFEHNRHMLGSTPAVLEALNTRRERLTAPRRSGAQGLVSDLGF